MINKNASFLHHLFNVAQAQWVCCVSTGTHQHDFQWIVQTLEHFAQLAYHHHLRCRCHAVIVCHSLLRQNLTQSDLVRALYRAVQPAG